MLNLSQIISRGKTRVLAFSYYITNNPRQSERSYILADDAQVSQREKQKYTPDKKAKLFSKKTPITFLDTELYDEKYANVTLGNETGYVSIDKIMMPGVHTQLINPVNISQAINDYILEQGCPINIRLLGEKRIYKNISYALDYKINLSKPNYRTNLILCQDKAKPIDDESMYISYRPRNRGVSTGLTGKEFNNVYVHSTEYKKYPIYKNTTNPYKLAKLACFGPKSTSMNVHSLQAIDCFASGKPYFQVFSEGDYYQLSFKNIFLTRNRFPTSFLKSEFEPKVTIQKDKTSIMSESIFI